MAPRCRGPLVLHCSGKHLPCHLPPAHPCHSSCNNNNNKKRNENNREVMLQLWQREKYFLPRRCESFRDPALHLCQRGTMMALSSVTLPLSGWSWIRACKQPTCKEDCNGHWSACGLMGAVPAWSMCAGSPGGGGSDKHVSLPPPQPVCAAPSLSLPCPTHSVQLLPCSPIPTCPCSVTPCSLPLQ